MSGDESDVVANQIAVSKSAESSSAGNSGDADAPMQSDQDEEDGNRIEGSFDSESDGHNHIDENEEKEGMESDEEKAPVAELTDEFGRPLSAYEIMRLERIKRNKAYLAKLGLEGDPMNGKKGTLLASDKDDMKKKIAAKKKRQKEVVVHRRTSVGRRTKTKKIDYTEKKVKQQADMLLKEEKLIAKKKKSEKPKKEDSLPLFIYREFKNMKVNRKQNVRTAERLERLAEVAVRLASRETETLRKKNRRLEERETRDLLVPVVHEIEKRRVDIIKALKGISGLAITKSSEEEQREQAVKVLEEAKIRFPEALQEIERSLGQMLLERLPPFQIVENKKCTKKGPKIKKANGKKKKETILDDQQKATLKLPANLNLEELHKVEEGLKVRVQKARNVGGPVTTKFADAVQRKWLDGDGPTAASFYEFIPQVGDTVLYYPCAHYDFLRQYPDIRCKKNRLALRRTLWERALDERKLQDQPIESEENDVEAFITKRKKEERTKPWWTLEWMSTIQHGAGRNPIICKVDRVVAEFPYDQESQTEIRRHQHDLVRAKNGKGKPKRRMDEEGRQKPTKNKPPMMLAVTLKPLAPILPPSNISQDNELSPPPVFSVLTFPTEKSPFLVPLALAFRSSLMFVPQDRVKVTASDGTWHKAQVVSANDDTSFAILCQSFFTVIKDFADIDIASVQKLDTLIAEVYSNSSNPLPIPEGDLRSAIQTILYQYHTRIGNETNLKQLNPGVRTKIRSPTMCVSYIINLIQNHLPKWGNERVLLDGKKSEDLACPWQLTFADESPREEAVTAALAQSILVSPNRMMSAGFVHLIDESIRVQLETVVQYLADTDPRAFDFVSAITDAIVPDYSRFVPLPMCLRKVLKRLKSQRVKYPKSSNKNGEDALEEVYGDIACCYYRSIEALRSDISDIFQNCLIYNAPDSDIVLAAFHMTKLICLAVDKVASDWQRDQEMKRKSEMAEIVDVESAARGELIAKSGKKTSIAANEIEDFGASFTHQLNRNWMESSNEDVMWLPQCGDKIIYNRMHHGKFINGHLGGLSSQQRTLPSIFPPSKNKFKKIVANSKKAAGDRHEDREIQSDMCQYWLGTIVWIRSVFPSYDAGQTTDDLTPLYAIGIKFHYKWLSKSIQVVYWKPCPQSSCIGEGSQESTCRCCGLSSSQSFLTPTWMGSMDKILPPYPLSLAYNTNASEIPAEDTSRIVHCLKELKERIVSNIKIDSFQPPADFLEFSSRSSVEIPLRFRYIFEENEVRSDIPNQNGDLGPNVSLSATKKLINYAYLAPWTLTGKVEDGKNASTRGQNSTVATSLDVTIPFHETIIANSRVSLAFICNRLKSGFYRSIPAIVNDIREACSACILYTVKDRIRSKRLGKNSEEAVLRAAIESCGVDIDAYFVDINQKSEKGKNGSIEKDAHAESTSNSSDNHAKIQQKVNVGVINFNNQERSILGDLEAIIRLHAVALMTCLETSIAEVGLGIDASASKKKLGSLSDDQETARRNLNHMLNSIGSDKMKFRKPISYGDESPKVNVMVMVKDIDENISTAINENPDDTNFCKSIVFTPKDYEGNQKLIKALGPFKKGDWPIVKVDVSCRGIRLKKSTAIILHPEQYQKNHDLSKFLSCFTKDSYGQRVPQVKICLVSESLDFIGIKEEGEDGTSPDNSIDADSTFDVFTNNTSSTIGKFNGVYTEPQKEPQNKIQNGTDGNAKIVENTDEKESEDDMSKPLQFSSSEYYNNANLVRALFCRSKRRQVCAKCILSKKGLFTCRVRSAHSNQDPTWIEYFRANEGVDGILAILDPSYNPPAKLMLSQNSEGGHGEEFDMASNVAASECGSEVKSQGLNELTSNEEDLKESLRSAATNQQKAEQAMSLAHILASKARMEIELPILLTSSFMHEAFHVDPEDGHFEICPKCGLGGDVICCGSCPMVSHPKCAAMAEIPDEEWHCHACVVKKKHAENQETVMKELAQTLGGGSNESNDTSKEKERLSMSNAENGVFDVEKTTDKVTTILEELKQSRQKPITIVLGQKLVRDFDGEEFVGEVTELLSDDVEFFKVLYEDDDEEQLTLEELQLCINAYKKKQKCNEVSREQIPLKRGRPRKYPIEDISPRRRGRPRKEPSFSPSQLKRGKPRKRVLVENLEAQSPLPKRRGRPPKQVIMDPIEHRDQPRKRGRPRKRLEASAELLDDRAHKRHGRPPVRIARESSFEAVPSRKRGRPATVSKPDHLLKSVREGRGRSCNVEMKKDTLDPPKKRGRGRPRKQVEVPSASAETEKALYPDYEACKGDSPNPGHVDKNMTYYCTLENDTSAKIASLIGCESWLDVAYIPENLERFPSLQDKKVKFRKGTLVRIAECNFAKKKAALLIF